MKKSFLLIVILAAVFVGGLKLVHGGGDLES